jgi:hypothetical protein
MAKVSPAHNVFEGEFSPLAEGRTDIERYGRAMRYMSNMIPCRTGPAIGRSGTYYEVRCMDVTKPSKILPFEYNEEETLGLEFGHFKLRFLYEYNGVAAHREVAVTVISAVAPFTYTAVGHDAVIGESVVFSGFPGAYNVNGVIATITNVAGDVITTDYTANVGPGISGSPVMAVVYEVVTPYHRDDVKNLRIVQELNLCHLFCTKSDGSGDYQMYELLRRDTFYWTILPMALQDGPFMDINTTNTNLIPVGTGMWIPNMTAATVPTGAAAASTEVAGHEAWRAFDGDIDTYWEANNAQEGWLEYAFETGFANQLLVFTGATSGAQTISTSSQQAGSEGWRASDRDFQEDWRSSGAVPQEWRIDFGSAQTVREYTIRASTIKEEFAPRTWTLDGSNTGTGGPWTNVDSRTNHLWNSGQKKQFTVQSPASFRYYRINVTAVNRQPVTTIIPAVGVKGTPGFVPRHTVTTKTPNFAGFAEVQMSYGSGQPRIVDGYTIYLGRYNKGKDVIEHAPKTWYFEGYDGTDWQLLDSQQDVTTWGLYRSDYFPILNDEPYKKYRIRIKTCVAAGDVNPRIGRLVMSSPDAPPITLRATSKVGINSNQGFLATDVGRQIRVRDADNMWRWAFIASVVSAVRVTLNLISNDPLVLEKRVSLWRLGLWSDTTGWPICGTLHEDRLFVGGASGFPDTFVGSVIGRHNIFRQISPVDVVTDIHAIVSRCNSKQMSRITWMKSAEEALRIGTGKAEWILSAPVDEALSARNARIRQTTKRGSDMQEPAIIDNDVVFVQKNQRALYALAYAQGQSGVAASYKSALVSKLGSHLMSPPVVQVVYQQEPHGLIWGRRSDGSIVAMSYSNDDDIFGGHRHNFGGSVYDLCVIYSPTDRQDSLWAVVKRVIGGVDQYYIEHLYRFWDFGLTLNANATFMDSALRYYGTTPTDKVYGLRHLNGQYVSVLADGVVYANMGPVTNGMLQLQNSALNIVVGLPYVMEGEIIAPEAGAEDGTAQGKSKRPHSAVLRLWESARGEVGRWNEDQNVLEWTPIEYNDPQTALLPETTLKTCLTKVMSLPAGYGTLGTVRFRQTEPLPFNVVGVYPQTYVEDDR